MRKIILDPYPRNKEEIFVASSLKTLNSKYKVIEFDGSDPTIIYNNSIPVTTAPSIFVNNYLLFYIHYSFLS